MKLIRRALRLFLIGILALIAVIFLCDFLVQRSANGRLYDDPAATPYNKVGILLGTSKFLKGNRENPYYRYRIDAATALLRSGKIKYIVVSGDNSTEQYNEPLMMRQDLIKNGIDSNRIYLDYAGLRTFDSMIRLKEIFGQTKTTVISQPFHNERALYIAGQHGIDAIGFNAADVDAERGLKVQAREKLARVKVFLDEIFNTEPKYGGAPVVIPQ